MRKKYFFILFILLFSCRVIANADEEVVQSFDVIAHYCAWYQVPWYLFPYTMPLRGYYNSWDPLVAAEQNEEKNAYGINIDMISWPGPVEGRQQEMMLTGYFGAWNLHTRKFAILYEIIPLLGNREVYDFNDPLLKEKFIADIDYLVDTLFTWYSDVVYRINNRPVVYIWTGKFKNFKQVSAEVREKVYLVGPEFILFPPEDREKERIENLKNFDAITSYGIDPVYLAQKYGSLNTEAVAEYVEAVIKWDRVLKKYTPNTDLWLPISFGYHDNRGDFDEYGRARVLTSTPTQAETFARVVKALADKLNRKRIFVVSYNEHYEGTGVEPSEEYGYLWISLLKKYFGSREENQNFLNKKIKTKWRRD